MGSGRLRDEYREYRERGREGEETTRGNLQERRRRSGNHTVPRAVSIGIS